MAIRQSHHPRQAPADVRLRGFADRSPLDAVVAWLDAIVVAAVEESVPPADAHRRVLHRPVVAPTDLPAAARAVIDGYALRAAETIGAGDYNPLTFGLPGAAEKLPPGAATLVWAGAALPAGADAILPFPAVQASDTGLDVFGSVAEGAGIEQRGEQARAGTILLAAGLVLRPQDCALLAALGIDRVAVVRQPRVRLVVFGPKPRAAGRDVDRCLLHHLVARDGGLIVQSAQDDDIGAALGLPGADLILVAGRTGTGPDDEAPIRLAEQGVLTFHGIAMRPGGSAGSGLVGTVPVILLPGDPVACWTAYELLAGRLVRRLAGRAPELPHARVEVPLRHKIVSVPGTVDLCPVRLVDGLAEPIGAADVENFISAAGADGFVIVPAPLEGYGAGARVTMYCHDRG